MRIHRMAGALSAILLFGVAARAASRLDKGEKLLFFPDYAWLAPDESHWNALIHGWCYSPEPDSKRRQWLIKTLARTLHLSKEEGATKDFERRAQWFLVKNRAGAGFEAKINGRPVSLKRARANGHIHDQLQIPGKAGEPTADAWIRIRLNVVTAEGDPATVPVLRLAPEGVIVVSDIDDTIKVTGVGHRREMVANTFVMPYQAVDGMAPLYRSWLAGNSRTAFFYLSAAPWPLYQELANFLKEAGFPRGILKLKHFRWKDQSFFSLWQSPEKYNSPVLEELAQHFPKRTFTLVGDSGEKDPEIYGAFARRHPAQVRNIYIRELGQNPESRYQKAFIGIDPVICHIFRTVRDLGFGQ